MNKVNVREGNCLDILPTMDDKSVNCCVTSPPYYGLRDYGSDEQIGQEETPEAFVESLVKVFREVRRVLADDGTLWLNLGDSYASTGGKSQPQPDSSGGLGNKKLGTRGEQGSSASYGGFERPSTISGNLKPKDLIGIPWRVALALQADGWYLRQDIIWSKPNPMPESVSDRCTKSHEYIFLLSKNAKYYYDACVISEPFKDTKWIGRAPTQSTRINGDRNDGGAMPTTAKATRNKRSVWEVPTGNYAAAHFATFPPELIKPCIMAGCPTGGTVLDPFGGSGTTGMVALELGRSAELIELNPKYVEIIESRTNVTPGFGF